MDKIHLTSGQSKALDVFRDWFCNSKEINPFILSGYAGSGKTFLSMKFLRLVEDSDMCWTVVAPTHKAVGVLRDALSMEGINPTWYPSTIHRLLRLKLKRKGALELCERTDQTSTSLEQLGLVLIDESSMVDSTLLEILLECAYVNKTRIVFVGDSAQLPPVGEVESPVFSIQKAIKAELQEVVRHQGPILRLASCFRDGRLACAPLPLLPVVSNEKSLVGVIDRDEWLEKAKTSLKEASMSQDPDSARILCYTNRTLESLVPHARRAVHGEMADQMSVLPGEVLISRMAVMAQASRDEDVSSEEPGMVLGSNRELLVQDVVPESCNLSEFGLISDSDWSVPIIETLFVDVRAGDLDLSLRLLPTVGSNSRGLLDLSLQRLKAKAKGLSQKEARPLWRQFFLIRDAFASLGPASVLTVHRSQGSTFGKVFVSPDVFWPKDLVLRRQLVYVSISRARDAVWMVGNAGMELLKRDIRDQLLESC